MRTHRNLGRLAGVLAVVATTTGGLAAFLSPAEAATGPTATLRNGTVTVTGTTAADGIRVVIDANRMVVDFDNNGSVDATFQRSRFQRVQVLGGAGDDGMSVTGTGAVPVTINGGAGSDGIGVIGKIGETGDGDAPTVIIGDDGNDNVFAATPGPVTIRAGAGDDVVSGGGAGVGQETISLGDGNDLFRSSLNAFVGVRRDIVDGGTGQDTIDMEGTFASESVNLTANAEHLIVTHQVWNQVDADNVEDVTYLGFGGLDDGGGGDAIAVSDLSGTDVTRFTPNFSAGQNTTAPNNSADTLTVRGTKGVDHFTLSGTDAKIAVTGLKAVVTPVSLQSQDFLLIDTLAGNDTVDSSRLRPGLVQLLIR
jgi:hypothetical protein